MPTFSDRSLSRLITCHPYLQLICKRAISIYDFSVVCGYRDEREQNKAFESGRSKVKYPISRHNAAPAKAVDIVPYPVDWEDLKRFHVLAGIIKGIASIYLIDIRWGGDWSGFKDYPHFELA